MTACRKYVIYDREFTSLFWLMVPPIRNHVPNGISQPSVLIWVRWTGWSLTGVNPKQDCETGAPIVWEYPREDLIVAGQMYQVLGSFITGERTENEVITRE